MKTGISLYFSNGVEKNEAIIRKARKAGIRYAFTSMHIPEETGIDYRGDARKLLEQCRDAGINLIVDVSPVTLEKLGCASFDELLSLGITYIRLDSRGNGCAFGKISYRFQRLYDFTGRYSELGGGRGRFYPLCRLPQLLPETIYRFVT